MTLGAVLKFGGASVATTDRIKQVAKIIAEKKRQAEQIVAVVSAMGETTNHLIELANEISKSPIKREYDMLISVGERITGALLAMALADLQVEAISFTGSQSGILTTSDHSEAKIQDVKPIRLVEALREGKVPIVSGFQGVSFEKNVTTLGRGGSDTTAVALACALGLPIVEFFKDVPGIFDSDPKENAHAKMFKELTTFEAMDIVKKGSKILHLRALELAELNGIPLKVCSFYEEENCTLVKPTIARKNTPIFEGGEIAACPQNI